MILFNAKTPRIVKCRTKWQAGDYFGAVWSLFNGLPNLMWPGGELAYNRMIKEARRKYGHPNDIRNWRMILWRELFHLVGGLGVFGCLYGFYILLEITLGHDTALLIYLWLSSFIAVWYIFKELILDVHDNGDEVFTKDFIDLLAWVSPLFLILALK